MNDPDSESYRDEFHDYDNEFDRYTSFLSRTNLISEILKDQLYLSDYHGANDLVKLKSLNIKGIINLGGYIDHRSYKIFPYIRYHHIFIDDQDDEPIHLEFKDTADFIPTTIEHDELDKRGAVLVHCWAGISSSITI